MGQWTEEAWAGGAGDQGCLDLQRGEWEGWCWRQVDSGVAPPNSGHSASTCLAGHGEAVSRPWAASLVALPSP